MDRPGRSTPEILSASSVVYALYKFGPSVVVVAAVLLALGIGMPPWLLVIWVPFAILFHAYGAQFKHVALLGDCLVVSNGKREIHVPLVQVARVSQPWGRNPRTILLVLSVESAFGRQIMFIPAERHSFLEPWSWRESRMAGRLRELSRQASVSGCTHTGVDKES